MQTDTLTHPGFTDPTVPWTPSPDALERRRRELLRHLAQVDEALAAARETAAASRDAASSEVPAPAFDHPLPVAAG